MSGLDHLVADAVAQQVAPFLVAMAASSQGVLWQGSAGEASPSREAGPDILFRMFSMTRESAAWRR